MDCISIGKVMTIRDGTGEVSKHENRLVPTLNHVQVGRLAFFSEGVAGQGTKGLHFDSEQTEREH